MAYSRQELIDALHRLAERVGRTPMRDDVYECSDIPSHTTYASHFGSWREALKAAGIPLDPTQPAYDRETLLQHLRNLAEELGRTPTVAELNAANGPCDKTDRNRFGKWSTALPEAGLEPSGRGRRYHRDELLHILRRLAEELGHAPTTVELRQREDLPRPSTYRAHFGHWSAALTEAGLAPRYPEDYREAGGSEIDGGKGNNAGEEHRHWRDVAHKASRSSSTYQSRPIAGIILSVPGLRRRIIGWTKAWGRLRPVRIGTTST